MIVTIISILSFFISFAQEDKNTIVIALFEEGDYKLTDQADTLLKLFLTNLFKEPFPDFTTVEIIHDQFLEEGTESFYYIKFTSSDSIFRIAYWLDRKESLLTIHKEYHPFKSIILTCKGVSQCEPNELAIGVRSILKKQFNPKNKIPTNMTVDSILKNEYNFLSNLLTAQC